MRHSARLVLFIALIAAMPVGKPAMETSDGYVATRPVDLIQGDTSDGGRRWHGWDQSRQSRHINLQTADRGTPR